LRKSQASSTFLAQKSQYSKECGSHNSHPYKLYSELPTLPNKNHNKQEKHVIYHSISKTIYAHIMKSGKKTFFSI